MRLSLLLALVAPLALTSATAQTADREGVIADDGAGEARVLRWSVRPDTTLDEARTVEIRLDSLGARLGGLFSPSGPLGARMRRFEIEVDGDAPAVRFETADDGVDAETRERMRELDREARRLARAARAGDRPAERELDGVLAELFDLRGEARQQRADALRRRADALRDQAAELDAETARRAADRDRVIEARKREMLDAGAASDW